MQRSEAKRAWEEEGEEAVGSGRTLGFRISDCGFRIEKAPNPSSGIRNLMVRTAFTKGRQHDAVMCTYDG